MKLKFKLTKDEIQSQDYSIEYEKSKIFFITTSFKINDFDVVAYFNDNDITKNNSKLYYYLEKEDKNELELRNKR